MTDFERRADATLITAPKFEAKEDHVVAVLPIEGFGSFGLRFESPEHLLEFFTQLVECAAEVWPDHPIIKMYQEE
jgi:hypothetical protein